MSDLDEAMVRHPAGKEIPTAEDVKDAVLSEVIDRLAKRLGRLPTEDEVYHFITGSDNQRKSIWNQSTKETP